jgi:hypothetical protein
MSRTNYYDGEITIEPPLIWAQIQKALRNPQIADGWEVSLDINEVTTDTETGTNTIKTCSRIIPARKDSYKGYNIPSVIQWVVDRFPEHTFSGYIEREGETVEYAARFMVKDRKVVEIKPTIVWPEP